MSGEGKCDAHYTKDHITKAIDTAKKDSVEEIKKEITGLRGDIKAMKTTLGEWDARVKSIKAVKKYLIFGVLVVKFGLWGSISSLLRHDGNIEAVVKDLQDESKARHFRGLKEVK